MPYTPMYLFMLLDQNEWNIAFTISLSVIGGLVAIVAWFFSRKLEAYDKHMDEASKDKQLIAVMESRLGGHLAEDVRRFDENAAALESSHRTLSWLGDCMMTLGAKLNVDLPKRPQ